MNHALQLHLQLLHTLLIVSGSKNQVQWPIILEERFSVNFYLESASNQKVVGFPKNFAYREKRKTERTNDWCFLLWTSTVSTPTKNYRQSVNCGESRFQLSQKFAIQNCFQDQNMYGHYFAPPIINEINF